MKNIIGTVYFTLGFVAVVVSLAVVWIIYRKDYQTDVKIPKKVAGINSVGVEYDRRRIFLNVRGDKVLSCNEVYKLLNIEPLLIEGKIYTPVCGELDSNLVQVIYSLQDDI